MGSKLMIYQYVCLYFTLNCSQHGRMHEMNLANVSDYSEIGAAGTQY